MNPIIFTAAKSGLADKLQKARYGAGLSTREVAERLPSEFQVSHTTIANYEKSKGQPTIAVLHALSELYHRPLKWFLESGPTLTGVRYRSQQSRLREGDKHWFEAQAQQWVEAYVRLERYLGRELTPQFENPQFKHAVTPKEVAVKLREILGVAENAPVVSVVDALEAFGIRVIELSTDLRIDGMAAMFGKEPVVVLNPTVANDRQRISGLHELIHIIMQHCIRKAAGASESKADEAFAFECARHILLPNDQLKEAFNGQSFVKLVKYKEAFGISVSAMIYAAHKEHLLSDAGARHLWIEMGKRNWRVKEPGYVRPDRATRFEQLVDGAVTSGQLTWARAAEAAAVREDELRERVRRAEGSLMADEHEPERGEPTFQGLRLAK